MKARKEPTKNLMPGRSVFCVASSRIQANRIVDHLTNAGFAAGDISVVFPDGNAGRATDADRRGESVAASGLGLALGGMMGWLAGNAVFSLPGFGPLVTCGPIGGVFKASASRAPKHGVKTALVNMGIPRNEAGLYQENVRGGQVLVCFHANDWREADAARKIFQAMGASNISILGDKASALLPPGLSGQGRTNPASSDATI